jgi:hypothetical protein
LRVGCTGTIVLGRSAELLVHADGMDGFGYWHRCVRPLGDGWQLVETGGHFRTPDPLEPCRRVAASTGWPVFAAQVFDSDWARLCTAADDRAGPLTRLGDATGYRADELRGVRDLAADDLAGALLQWSAAAGLRADRARLHTAPTEGLAADDAVFALVRALGARAIGRPLPRAFPVDGWPFSAVSDLARMAEVEASYREKDDDPAPVQDWETAAASLDRELWAVPQTVRSIRWLRAPAAMSRRLSTIAALSAAITRESAPARRSVLSRW